MAKFVCLLLVLAVLVQEGFSLNCYQCNSEKQDGCLKSASPKTLLCQGGAGAGKSLCYYKEVIDSNNKKIVSVNASCAILPPGKTEKDLNECMPGAGQTIKECRTCETDLCNSSPAFASNFYTILCLPVMYLITKFL